MAVFVGFVLLTKTEVMNLLIVKKLLIFVKIYHSSIIIFLVVERNREICREKETDTNFFRYLSFSPLLSKLLLRVRFKFNYVVTYLMLVLYVILFYLKESYQFDFDFLDEIAMKFFEEKKSNKNLNFSLFLSR